MINVNQNIGNLNQPIAPLFSSTVNIEQLFEIAIETANAGNKLKAMEIAREALMFAKKSNDYLAVYIHGFLASLSIDFKKFNSARIHCYNAKNRLSKNHFSYNTDAHYLDKLLAKISELDVDFTQLEFEALAA